MAQPSPRELNFQRYSEAKTDGVWAWYKAQTATSKADSEELGVTAEKAQQKAAEIKGIFCPGS